MLRQKTQGKFIEVQHIRPNAPAFRYTIPELLDIERETIERVRAGRGTVQPISTDHATIAGRYGASFDEDQLRVVHESLVTTNQNRHPGRRRNRKDRGPPCHSRDGGRKRLQGVRFRPDLTGSQGPEEIGIDAETLQAHLTKYAGSTDTGPPRLFCVDESSLASSQQMHDFLRTVQPEDRVLLIGDTKQHQSVDAGRIFEELQDSGMTVTRLEKIVRQKDEGLRQVVETIAAGNIAEGVDLLATGDRVHSIEHRQERFAAIARAFAEAPESTLVVSPDNL